MDECEGYSFETVRGFVTIHVRDRNVEQGSRLRPRIPRAAEPAQECATRSRGMRLVLRIKAGRVKVPDMSGRKGDMVVIENGIRADRADGHRCWKKHRNTQWKH